MSIINDAEEIIFQLEKIKENLNSEYLSNSNSLTNNSNDKELFAHMEVRKFSGNIFERKDQERRKNSSFYKNRINKEKTKNFRVTYLRTVIPYLNIKSIMNLSLLNKEFHYFIKSIYFYKFVENIREFKKSKIKRSMKIQRKMSLSSKNSHISQKSITDHVVGGLYGAVSGTFSLFGKNFLFIFY